MGRWVLWVASIIATLGCNSKQETPQPALPPAAIDARTPVVLPGEARQAVLREMRQMLGAMGGAMAAAASGDTTQLLAALAPATSAAAADPGLEALLPKAWRELAEQTHGGFDSLIAAVRRGPGRPALGDTVLIRLARLSGSCSTCHETFQLTGR
jgi:cytochrome c556